MRITLFSCAGIFLALILSAPSCQSTKPPQPLPSLAVVGPTLPLEVPTNFPQPRLDSSFKITAAGVALGRVLFYDGELSSNKQIACATCHQQANAFTHHGHRLSHGVEDRLSRRNAPPIQNLAWAKNFFWDGGVHHLDLTPLAAIRDTAEMNSTNDTWMLSKIQYSRINYSEKFYQAYGTREITSQRLLRALAQFMSQMVSANSAYDRYSRQKDSTLLSKDEREGLILFQRKCSQCHAGELFTDYSFRNNGLGAQLKSEEYEWGITTEQKARIAANRDSGRYRVTLKNKDLYRFRVPSLRNVQYTQPYMHDGRFTVLAQVLRHYATGVENSPTLDPLLRRGKRVGIPMTDDEQKKIITFLKTLSDPTFVRDKRFEDPRLSRYSKL
ncbi:cytochrome-c peroxidase (plasmid) [Fibrella sp. USSR17]